MKGDLSKKIKAKRKWKQVTNSQGTFFSGKVYFLGEGPKCEHYVRRFNRIMKFGKLNTTVVNATTM